MAREKAQIDGLIEKSGGLFTDDDRSMLDGLSDDQVSRFEKQFGESSKEPEGNAEPTVNTAAGKGDPKGDPKPATLEEYVAAAPAEMQDMLEEGLRVGRERKAVAIKALKDSGRCDLTDDSLRAMSQPTLDQLVKLANVQTSVDFSGQTPRVPERIESDAPDAPDLVKVMREARA